MISIRDNERRKTMFNFAIDIKEQLIPGEVVEATFVELRTLVKDDALKGFFVVTEEYDDQYMNYNSENPANNFELMNLGRELGIQGKNVSLKTFNDQAGKKIRMSAIQRDIYTNVHFGQAVRATAEPMFT